jgi:hypothetical protein
MALIMLLSVAGTGFFRLVSRWQVRKFESDRRWRRIGTFGWDFKTTGSDGQKVWTAGCDLLRFVGDKVATKNAFRKVGG